MEGFAGDLVRSAGFMAASFALHGVSAVALPRLLPRSFWKSLSRLDQIRAAELIVSTAHGISVAALSAQTLLRGAYDGDVLDAYPEELNTSFAISIGYSFYDLVAMRWYGDKDPSMYLHHLIVGGGCLLSIFYKRMSFIPGITQLSEATVITANLHWFLKKAKLERHPAYGLNLFMRALVHVATRAPLIPWLYYHAIRVHGWGAFWSGFWASPLPISTVSFSGTAFLILMNILWTAYTVRAAWRHATGWAPPAKSA